ncbi:MAG: OsmC family peroxiredoxin, partial [Polyangiaceae bacterium]|nr:OsmC family peroxiredoxin [Polyangiaceae bacterium]
MSDEVNGVPLEKMFGAIAKVKESSDLAQFEFVAENEWITGTGSRSSIHEWHGMGGDHLHVE